MLEPGANYGEKEPQGLGLRLGLGLYDRVLYFTCIAGLDAITAGDGPHGLA